MQLTKEDIVFWVRKINKKFGKNTDVFTIAWVEKLIEYGAIVELNEDWYVLYVVIPDAWGNLQLNILSACCDGVRSFFDMQSRIYNIAKENGVKYILQGSELDEKYNKWLIGKGYRPFCFRKEV